MEKFNSNNQYPIFDNKYMKRKKFLLKYIFYGILGVTLEIFYTGFIALLNNDLTLEGKSYLWMFFIYGLGVVLEPVNDRIRDKNIVIGGVI